ADTTHPAAPAGSVTELAVLRLEPGGTPDTTFGTEGTATVSVTGLTSSNGTPGRDIGSAIALQPDGRIVVAGSATATGFNLKFAVARLLSDGVLDTDFTDTGAMTIDFFAFTDVAESVAVTTDGKIVVSGQVQNPGEVYGVARLAPSDEEPPSS
ncbi:MAG TPA: hypothetical protein VFR46_01785, partial [Actinomycetes bacterium]|nr:hypothetical protein [Actinomycetes bacterium]